MDNDYSTLTQHNTYGDLMKATEGVYYAHKPFREGSAAGEVGYPAHWECWLRTKTGDLVLGADEHSMEGARAAAIKKAREKDAFAALDPFTRLRKQVEDQGHVAQTAWVQAVTEALLSLAPAKPIAAPVPEEATPPLLSVFYNIKFEGFYPVGTAAVVVAFSQAHAAFLLNEKLAAAGLPQKEEVKPEEMILVELKPGATVLLDGNY